MPSRLGALLALVWFAGACHGQTWEQTCPTACTCKWYNNKKVAECEQARFTSIPSKLSTEFQVLDLTDNELRSLFKNAFKKVNLVNLNKLILANNIITEIDADAFSDLKLLMDLDLSNNRIAKLHPKTFSGMEKMRNLILSGNPLTRLEAYQFPVLPNLQHLVIENCKLSYINNLAFNNLPQLTSVSLKANELTTIQRELFTSRTSLKAVYLGGNKWICDCHLRSIVYWIQKKNIGESQLSCYSPERVAGKRWLDLDLNDDLACAPVIYVPEETVFIKPGTNATMSCGASGEPLPRIKWIREGLVVRDTAKLLPTDPQINFFLTDEVSSGIFWLNLTVEYVSSELMNYEPSVNYKCKVENPAQLKEHNVTLVLQTEAVVPEESDDSLNLYLIIAIITVLLLVLILIILIVVFCLRKKQRAPCTKMHVDERTLTERNNILIVNPVEKPPRKNEQYEKLPQAEMELTDLSKGTHKNFEEMNYPEERVGRIRAPLTALEEEEFDQSSQKLLDVSVNTSTTLDFTPQYPDLLEKVHFPRAISPTELSYHSLNNPMFSPSPEWRYSYVYPSEYSPLKYQTLYNIPPTHPQQPQRPGYVTLPRRPRTSSLTNATQPTTSGTLPTQSSPLGKFDPVYDTLGPRTTADGTSRTDLTHSMSRSMIESYPSSSARGASPSNSLPAHYVPLPEEREQPASNTLQVSALTPAPKADSAHAKKASLNNGHLASDERTRLNASPKPPSLGGNPSRQAPVVAPSALASGVGSTLAAAATEGASLASKKKVPPKPPPKPANKRLSVSSTNSDAASRLSSVGSERATAYQEEGPDGTEV